MAPKLALFNNAAAKTGGIREIGSGVIKFQACVVVSEQKKCYKNNI